MSDKICRYATATAVAIPVKATGKYKAIEIALRDADGTFHYPIDMIERVEIHPTYKRSGGTAYCSGRKSEIDHLTLMTILVEPGVPIVKNKGFKMWCESSPDDPPFEFVLEWLRKLAEVTREGIEVGILHSEKIRQFYADLDARYDSK
jgi:hypothetical protein